MADGAADRPPYWAVQRLRFWADVNRNVIDGRLLLAGHPDGVSGLDLRQLCNVAYIIQVESLDEKEFKHFNRELVSDPTKGPVSKGTSELMGLFGAKTPPPRKPVRKADRPLVHPDRKAPTRRGP